MYSCVKFVLGDMYIGTNIIYVLCLLDIHKTDYHYIV